MVLWHIWLERQSSKWEVVGSSPTVGKNFLFCNSHFLCMPHSQYKWKIMENHSLLTNQHIYIGQ